MKIAILSDIHANAEALSAVLKQCEIQKIDHYYILGDIVGYYFEPNQVISLLKPLNKTVIKGNHEDMLLDAINDKYYLNQVTFKYGIGLEVAIEKLNKEVFEWINSLPYEKCIKVEGLNIKLTHGNRYNWKEYLYPDTPSIILNQYCSEDYDFIFTGHSHYPFLYNSGKCVLVNVGSVGMNKDFGGLASWCILNTETKTVSMQKTPYNVTKLISKINNIDSPNKSYLISVLTRNNN
ncbi:metallophosphoesterase family protein [Lysinibacillus xylanilyticus]|uniref:metallophosphoesterase family protein n=1 Tax=Lysinibacillus xylanilyticus TaxID=582475 RepID=UPI003CFE3AA2